MFFYAKMGILGKNLYVIHTLFILYFAGNHTLFGEKLYFIWKFGSGNTGTASKVTVISNQYTIVHNSYGMLRG